MAASEYPALKEMFNPDLYRKVARGVGEVYPGFDRRRFLHLALARLGELNLLQRLRRTSESLHATLPADYEKSITLLRQLAPRLDGGFVTLFLPDFVGLYGLDYFDVSMDALKFFTPFGSSEFGIRPFLRQDLPRTLKVMEKWARDPDEHVRRLACEGCRPRLPWSFRLDPLVADPSPAAKILETLKADSSLYVRKSVANHLNDITKDHPAWVLDRVERWDLENARTAWIAKRALRTLIKAGDRRALAVIGASHAAEVKVTSFSLSPAKIRLGDTISLALSLTSRARQKLVIDYKVHYVKKSGASSAKVFKWKELQVSRGETVEISRRQVIRDFSTRKHMAGHHRVEVLINGDVFARDGFLLST